MSVFATVNKTYTYISSLYIFSNSFIYIYYFDLDFPNNYDYNHQLLEEANKVQARKNIKIYNHRRFLNFRTGSNIIVYKRGIYSPTSAFDIRNIRLFKKIQDTIWRPTSPDNKQKRIFRNCVFSQ